MVSAGLQASEKSGFDPQISVILDGHYKSADSALSESGKGFGLGHTELGISAAIDDMFYGKFTGVMHDHDGSTEFELEEAFLQTLSMPAGLSVRAGRFLSNVGYLNSQHTHSDAFTDRPAVYRALLGSHYYDDGARLDVVMPTDLYWTMGVEAFSGKKMQATAVSNPDSIGVFTGYSKIGGDIGVEQSWQLGVSYLQNQNGKSGAAVIEHDHHTHGADVHAADDHAHSHDHSHSAQYTGKNLYGVDFVWKWAPNGNYKYNHLAISGEYFRADNYSHQEGARNYHDGWYLSSVYQFNPTWASGIRYGEFTGTQAHGHEHDGHTDYHWDQQKLKETEWMVSWSHSHFSTVRLQYTHQSGYGFENIQNNIITLQYVMSLGAHDAHQY